MTDQFDNQVAVITGAGSGIGYAIAQQLAQQGASVVLNDVDDELAASAAAQIQSAGGRCLAVPGDAGALDVINRMVRAGIDTFGGVNIAIANAGLTHFGAFLEAGLEDFQRVVNLNLQGAYFLTQAACRHMRERGQGGRVLLMSSVLSHQPYPKLASYCMTKAGLNMLARTLALELAPFGITINALAPGATITERTLRDDPNYDQEWQRITPHGGAAEPEAIAKVALFLLSPDADHITGQTLLVDGGWSSMGHFPTRDQPPAFE